MGVWVGNEVSIEWSIRRRRLRIEGQPKFFKSNRYFDAIGSLGSVEVDIRGSLRCRHGSDVRVQLIDSSEHEEKRHF